MRAQGVEVITNVSIDTLAFMFKKTFADGRRQVSIRLKESSNINPYGGISQGEKERELSIMCDHLVVAQNAEPNVELATKSDIALDTVKLKDRYGRESGQ